MITLHPVPLSAAGFAPYGRVIEVPGAAPSPGEGNRRFDDLAWLDGGPGGAPMLSLLRARAVAALPMAVPLLERHPLGSQSFIPAGAALRLVVVVAQGDERPDLGTLAAFVTDGSQGIHYPRGCWHAPVAALEAGTLVVIDRKGDGANCDLFPLETTPVTVAAP